MSETEQCRNTQFRREIKRLYWVEGLSQKEVAEKAGWSKKAVVRGMRRHNIPVRPPWSDKTFSSVEDVPDRRDGKYVPGKAEHLSQEDVVGVKRLYWVEGYSQGDIAEEYDCTISSVRSFMRRHDIPTRSVDMDKTYSSVDEVPDTRDD